ncbi:hypothetical protein ACGFIY_21545 [Micromonospora chersina]|uniref:hypothetical protein n=1 Tax=Micromonospora chersina TaxID=47854 RepID=UPI00371FF352
MAMDPADLTRGTRVVDLGYPEPQRVLVVDRPVPGRDRPTVECHAEDDSGRRAYCWVSSLAPAPPIADGMVARKYQWDDLRDTTAGELRPGDVVFSLAAFQVVHVAKDGRVSGGSVLGQLEPRGMARTVVARDGDRITFRNHPDGHEWAADINPDHPILRLESPVKEK